MNKNATWHWSEPTCQFQRLFISFKAKHFFHHSLICSLTLLVHPSVPHNDRNNILALMTLTFNLWHWPLRSTQVAIYAHTKFCKPRCYILRHLTFGPVTFCLVWTWSIHNIFGPEDFDLWPWPLRSTQVALSIYAHTKFCKPRRYILRHLIFGLVTFCLVWTWSIHNIFGPEDFDLWPWPLRLTQVASKSMLIQNSVLKPRCYNFQDMIFGLVTFCLAWILVKCQTDIDTYRKRCI